MGSLLIVTGPPGAGKSTVAARLARRLDPSVLVAGDAFFGFLATGAIEPWLPASHAQNTVVTEATARATARFADHYDTVFDGIVGPWFLSTFLAEGDLDAVDYVILLPAVGVCVDRVRTRSDHDFADEAATRHMHDQFARSGAADRHVIDNGRLDPAATVAEIEERRARGLLRVDASAD